MTESLFTTNSPSVAMQTWLTAKCYQSLE